MVSYVQHIVYPDGTPKGMTVILEERWVDTIGMEANDLRSTLKTHSDITK